MPGVKPGQHGNGLRTTGGLPTGKSWWRLGLLVWLLVGRVAWADLQVEFERALVAAKLGRTRYGILVAEADSGRILVNINADESMVPASNMKLFTSAAALSRLGSEFFFQTELRLLNGEPERAVVLVRGDGDPGFCDPKLLEAHGLEVEKVLGQWVEAVRGAGVRRVARLIVDDRVFDRQFVHPAWPIEQLSSWYCAQVAGMNFYDNTLDVYPVPTSAGRPPRIELVPEAPFVGISNHAVTGGGDEFLVTRRMDRNELVISGRVQNRPATPIWVTVHDPPMFFGQIFADRLGRAGISVERIERPEMEDRLEAGRLLHVVRTSIGAVLYRCNKDSQNLFAECLLKRLGRAVTGNPGSWENGAAAVRQFLAERLGPSAAAVVISDGSGMSRDNRVTARTLVQLLVSMARDPQVGPLFMQSLSQAGRDGTLERRLGQELSGQLWGKTGYIAGVSTLSGYLVLPRKVDPSGHVSGGVVAFSFLFNDISPSISVQHIKAVQNDLVRIMDRELSGF